MNGALLVRGLSYWSAQVGAHESGHGVAWLSEKGCGIRRNVYGCERVTGLRINLARGLARAIATCPGCPEGMTVSNASREVISLSWYVASLQEMGTRRAAT
jgi:hypothetical protein